jgi:hypothetical protein
MNDFEYKLMEKVIKSNAKLPLDLLDKYAGELIDRDIGELSHLLFLHISTSGFERTNNMGIFMLLMNNRQAIREIYEQL